MSTKKEPWAGAVHPPRPLRRDAARNYESVLRAAAEVLGEAGAEASMAEIAARAGVGVGTVYRRFSSKDALIDELLRLVAAEMNAAVVSALARQDAYGLEEVLRAFGQSFADHARYASLLLAREPDPDVTRCIRAAVSELLNRAVAAGTIRADITAADVLAVLSAVRGLLEAESGLPPDAWQRFLDIHLAGMRPPR